jgi:hypothetical protein
MELRYSSLIILARVEVRMIVNYVRGVKLVIILTRVRIPILVLARQVSCQEFLYGNQLF